MIIRYAVLNDVHFPYESPAYKRAIKIIASWNNLKAIILNGDICEISSIKSHPAHPEDERFLGKEIEYANSQFDLLQETFQEIPIAYVCGNHEHRVFRYIQNQAPHLWGLIDCPKLFKFDERPGWRFFQYGPRQLIQIGKTGLYARHEPLGMGLNPAKATADNSYVDVIFGHTHRYQVYSHKKFGPTPILTTAISNGWLGDASAKIFDYRPAKESWSLGFAEILVDSDTWEYHYNFVNLADHNPFYEGDIAKWPRAAEMSQSS
jgi:predicted phosphodiesterase